MEEVAPTNLIIWVSSLQICSFVYFILQEDCVNQVWGPVYERMNTYSIRYYAIFEYEEEGDDPWAFTIVMDNIPLSPVVYHTVIDKSPDKAFPFYPLPKMIILLSLGHETRVFRTDIGGHSLEGPSPQFVVPLLGKDA